MRVLSLVRELDPVHGEALNSVQILTGLAARGADVEVPFQHDGAFRGRLGEVTDDLWRIGQTDVISDWLPPRPRWAPSPVQRLVGWVGDLVRIGAAAVQTCARTVRRRPDAVFEVRQFGLVWAALVSWFHRAPLVCQVNTVVDARPRRDRSLLALADDVVAVSQFVADRLGAMGVDGERVHVVHNGVDPADYPAGGASERAAGLDRLGLDPDLPVVLFYGQLNPVKGVEVLVEASRLMATPHHLVLAGRFTDAPYVELLHARSAGLDVTWLDHQDDVVPLLHCADVVVLPSVREEAFGRVLIEAMSTGRPAVASRIGGMPEVLTGEHAARLADPGDAGSLAAALDAVASWRRTDPALGDRCRAHVLEHFTLERTVAGISAVLAHAAGRRRGPVVALRRLVAAARARPVRA